MKEIDTYKIGVRMEQRRKQLGYTLADIAEQVSVAFSTIQRYEKGKIENIKLPVLESIARVLQVDVAWLLGKTDEMRPRALTYPLPQVTDEVVTFPIIGEVAAGYEHLAQEVWDGDTVDIPVSFLHGRPRSDFFVLRVCGDSMYPLYLDGDTVLVLKTDTLEYSGQTALVLYNTEEATLKKVEFAEGEDWLRLVPVNPMYQPRLLEGEELAACRIIGIPRYLIRETK